jgi:Growth-arrest specific micro-tubule binding
MGSKATVTAQYRIDGRASQRKCCTCDMLGGNAGLKSLLLEKRVEVLSEALEMKEAQLGEVLAAAHLDPTTQQQASGWRH